MSPSAMGENLLKLVDLDTVLQKLERQRTNLPQIRQLEELAAAHESLDEKAEQTAKLQLRQDLRIQALRDENSAVQAKIAEDQNQIEANGSRYKEVALLSEEIDNLAKRSEKIAFDIGELTTDSQRISLLQAEITQRLDQISAKETELQRTLLDFQNKLEEQSGKLRVQRQKLVDLLSPEVLNRYNRQVALKKDAAAARLEERTCGGCHIELTEGQVFKVKHEADANGIGSCPTCHRLLVL
ncbi:MAG: hypothetical protein FWC59_00270 [Actinomycetia bacterium]|nr:hypothetical protein [Actinomycetes bacterium]